MWGNLYYITRVPSSRYFVRTCTMRLYKKTLIEWYTHHLIPFMRHSFMNFVLIKYKMLFNLFSGYMCDVSFECLIQFWYYLKCKKGQDEYRKVPKY